MIIQKHYTDLGEFDKRFTRQSGTTYVCSSLKEWDDLIKTLPMDALTNKGGLKVIVIDK